MLKDKKKRNQVRMSLIEQMKGGMETKPNQMVTHHKSNESNPGKKRP